MSRIRVKRSGNRAQFTEGTGTFSDVDTENGRCMANPSAFACHLPEGE